VGQDDQWIIAQCLQDGIPIPDRIKNQPELLPGLELYLNAFHDLSSCRQVGMGVGFIPFTAVLEYARWHGFDKAHSEDLHYHISCLDSAYVSWANKRRPKGDKEE
jgi:hypothetical protein